jgi:hypothetical protein
MAKLIVEDGLPIAQAAQRFQVAWPTAKRWAQRYRDEGAAGMADRSSRPHHSPTTGAGVGLLAGLDLLASDRGLTWSPIADADPIEGLPGATHRVPAVTGSSRRPTAAHRPCRRARRGGAPHPW